MKHILYNINNTKPSPTIVSPLQGSSVMDGHSRNFATRHPRLCSCHHYGILLVIILLLASCTDQLISVTSTSDDDDADGIAFNIDVTEQADLIYDYGRTRAAAGLSPLDSATLCANTFGAHALQGDNPWSLGVHRMPLPLVGIHPGAAGIGSPSRSVGTEAAAPPQYPSTRAPLSEIAYDGIYFHDSLTIWGCVYNPETNYHRFLFEQILVKKIQGWRTSVHWPYDEGKGKYMRFCAISPSFEELDVTLVTPPRYEDGGTLIPPTFRYIVPEQPAEQRDLLFGSAGSTTPIDVQAGPTPGYGGSGIGYYEGQATTQKEQHLGQDDKTVALTFNHILTAVRFAQGKMPEGVTIKRIVLSHIKNQGVYDPSQGKWGNKTGDPLTWSDDLPEEYSNYTIYPDQSITDYANENIYIDGDSVLFLIPQTLDASAELQVVLTEDADASDPKTERTLKCSLAGDTWPQGYTVTYKITVGSLNGEYYLVLDAGTDDPQDIPKKGTTGTEEKYRSGSASHAASTSATTSSFTIHSFRNAKDYTSEAAGVNLRQAVPWQITGFSWTGAADSYAAANRPAWLTSITGWTNVNNAVGSTSGTQTPGTDGVQTVSYELAAQSYTHTTTHSSVLTANAAPKETDLSKIQPNGTTTGTAMTRETANCYIVNAVGSYKFPAVYGNGISGGTTSDLSENTLFLDHRGKPITSPNIYRQINSYPYEEVAGPENVPTEKAYRHSTSGAFISQTAYDALLTEDKANYVQLSKQKRFQRISYNKNADTGEGNPSAISQEIIWQDADGLFSIGATAGVGSYNAFSDTSDGGFGYVEFSVVTNAARPGNCVIALKGRRTTKTILRYYSDDACTTQVGTDVVESTVLAPESEREILWTWHIWMTDEVYPNNSSTEISLVGGAITNDDAQRTTLTKQVDKLYPSYSGGSKIVTITGGLVLPVPLGWVPTSDAFGLYQQRDTWVEIQQTNAHDNKIHFHIHQNATQDPLEGTATVYQWGRPTPLTTRSVYPSKTPDFAFEAGTTPLAAYALVHPRKVITAWGADADYWSGTGKTLYDPCPPGFRMPAASVLSSMAASADQIFFFPPTGYVDGGGTNMTTTDATYSFSWTDDHSGTNATAVKVDRTTPAVTIISDMSQKNLLPLRPWAPAP